MFLFAGSVKEKPGTTGLKITNLITTRPDRSGLIGFDDAQNVLSGRVSDAERQLLEGPGTGEPQALAVLIEGEGASPDANATEASPEDEEDSDSASSEKRPIRAIYVADIDLMLDFFSENRKRPEQFEDFDLYVQNITFVLNVVDVLAGEENYPKIRSHEPQHVPLLLIEDLASDYRDTEIGKQKELKEKFDQQIQDIEEQNQKDLAKFQERVRKLQKDGAVNPAQFDELSALMQQLQAKERAQERKLQIQREKLEAEYEKNRVESRRAIERNVKEIQGRCKMLAILIPPIPPLLVGAGVFVSRRVREREGIAKNRLR